EAIVISALVRDDLRVASLVVEILGLFLETFGDLFGIVAARAVLALLDTGKKIVADEVVGTGLGAELSDPAGVLGFRIGLPLVRAFGVDLAHQLLFQARVDLRLERRALGRAGNIATGDELLEPLDDTRPEDGRDQIV